MAIVVTNLGVSTGSEGAAVDPDINNAASATSYSSGSVAPPTDGIAAVFAIARRAGAVDTPTMSGWGITWTRLTTLTFNSDYGLSVFLAPLAGATTGAITVDYGGNTQLGFSASVFQVTGVELAGGIGDAYVAANVKTATGTGTSGSVVMDAAGSSENRVISGFAHGVNELGTVGTDFTELDNMRGSGPARAVLTEYRGDAFDTGPDASWATSSGWGVVAIEMVAESGGTTTTLTADHGSFDANGQAALFQTSVSVEHGSFS